MLLTESVYVNIERLWQLARNVQYSSTTLTPLLPDLLSKDRPSRAFSGHFEESAYRIRIIGKQ